MKHTNFWYKHTIISVKKWQDIKCITECERKWKFLSTEKSQRMWNQDWHQDSG